MTGDAKNTAQYIGKMVGIESIFAEVSPEDKLMKIRELQAQKHIVAMVGDGVNDAPALAQSDVGIAMGGLGSDAAIEAADVVIMNDNPSKVVSAIKIAQKTMQIVKENIIFALGIKILFLILAFTSSACSRINLVSNMIFFLPQQSIFR